MSPSFDVTLNAIKGKNFTQKIPLALWKHFPNNDLNLNDLIKSHINFQNAVKSDLIKFSPNSKYAMLDFGLKIDKEFNNLTGSYLTKEYPINSMSDWERIDEIDPLDGNFGIQLAALSKISKHFENIPICMTIFFPLMIADKLVNKNNLINHLKHDSDMVKDRLNVINKVISNFALASLDEGANGLFLATQHGQKDNEWDESLWRKLAYPIDRNLLKTVMNKTLFTILHLHGSNIFFEEILNKFKVDAINWDSVDKIPSIIDKNSETKFEGGLLGGLNEQLIISAENLENNSNELLNNITENFQNHLSQLVVSPGCVLTQSLPIENLLFFIKKLKLTKFHFT